MYRNSREARRRKEAQEVQKYQIQAEGCGVISTNHRTIIDFLKSQHLTIRQWILQKKNMYLQVQKLVNITQSLNLMLILHHLQYIIQELPQYLQLLRILQRLILLPRLPNSAIIHNQCSKELGRCILSLHVIFLYIPSLQALLKIPSLQDPLNIPSIQATLKIPIQNHRYIIITPYLLEII